MSGAPTGGSPRGLRERLPAEGAVELARSAGKAAPAKPGAETDPAVEGGAPGAVDFTAALVVAGTLAPSPATPSQSPATPVPGDVEGAAAAVRSRAEADRPRPALPRAALELKLPGDPGERQAPPDSKEPPPAGPPAPPAAPALEDRNLGGAVMSRAAHLSLDAGPAGEIGLHLRIRDGVADVRIDGSVAPLAEARSAELRLALAREGLHLGSLELSAGGGDPSRHGSPERPEPGLPAAGPGVTAPTPAGGTAPPEAPRGRGDTTPGRIHVEA